jgi:hypothetical protein
MQLTNLGFLVGYLDPKIHKAHWLESVGFGSRNSCGGDAHDPVTRDGGAVELGGSHGHLQSDSRVDGTFGLQHGGIHAEKMILGTEMIGDCGSEEHPVNDSAQAR